eukprot:7381392-Prymnesium_polylepis.1
MLNGDRSGDSDKATPWARPQVLSWHPVPGVKPSLQVYKLSGCDGETVMQGLDSLAERLREYKG